MARPVHAENLLSTLLFVALAGSACADAQAHGAVASPIARQYQCFKEGGYHWPPDGSQIPGIDCRQAYLAVGGGSEGSWPFQQWHEVAANPKDKGDTLERSRRRSLMDCCARAVMRASVASTRSLLLGAPRLSHRTRTA